MNDTNRIDYTQYRRSQIAELRPWIPGEDMGHISISTPDKAAGSPKTGDMIARNPANHDDQWLVAAEYFAANFEPMENNSDIHPAPAEFSQVQITADPILHFFHYAHLPEKLQATSRPFFLLAAHCVNTLPRNAERSVALRKLLEAKDAAVRANLPTGVMIQDQQRVTLGALRENEDFKTTRVASEKEIGIDEPVEVGGHDIDRDGPIPFDG